MADHNETGARGEAVAVDYLINKGYTILEKNWRHRRTEIDIIAKQNDILVFVEVKTRSDDFFGEPASYADDKKMKRIATGATVYMNQINHDWEVRFDVIGVLVQGPQRVEVRHYEDVYWG